MHLLGFRHCINVRYEGIVLDYHKHASMARTRRNHKPANGIMRKRHRTQTPMRRQEYN